MTSGAREIPRFFYIDWFTASFSATRTTTIKNAHLGWIYRSMQFIILLGILLTYFMFHTYAIFETPTGSLGLFTDSLANDQIQNLTMYPLPEYCNNPAWDYHPNGTDFLLLQGFAPSDIGCTVPNARNFLTNDMSFSVAVMMRDADSSVHFELSEFFPGL
eukprot:TRINITY_DN88_c0_g1::TRINITY_DN88_c0_g1_i1::g.14882::m.14882 TRINITY_DN88_c0_g1::TRINITY_DN88_c0_g1_i1::g.14882  ORF type:complete len:160 (-),score=10.81 TRINITY_DN88_c0_g1_i1:370-849(-)